MQVRFSLSNPLSHISSTASSSFLIRRQAHQLRWSLDKAKKNKKISLRWLTLRENFPLLSHQLPRNFSSFLTEFVYITEKNLHKGHRKDSQSMSNELWWESCEISSYFSLFLWANFSSEKISEEKNKFNENDNKHKSHHRVQQLLLDHLL